MLCLFLLIIFRQPTYCRFIYPHLFNKVAEGFVILCFGDCVTLQELIQRALLAEEQINALFFESQIRILFYHHLPITFSLL